MLRIDRVVTGYGRARVLDGLSVTVETGRTLAVLGPNGAGKSTLMRAICGAVNLWSGSIAFNDDDLGRTPIERRAELGIVLCPEGRHIFASLSIEENLMVGATALRHARGRNSQDLIEQGLARAYEMFPILAERRRSSGGALSGGQQQMLAIARALMNGPRLLLLDEPSLGLAPRIADEVYDNLARLKSDGLTIIVVEESASRPLAIADKAIVMRDGRIVRQGAGGRGVGLGDLAEDYLGAENG